MIFVDFSRSKVFKDFFLDFVYFSVVDGLILYC